MALLTASKPDPVSTFTNSFEEGETRKMSPSIQAAKIGGRLTLSNASPLEATATNATIKGLVPAVQEADFIINIEDKLTAAGKAATPFEAAKYIADANAAIAQNASAIYAKKQEETYQKFGIPQLQEQLNISMQEDRASKFWPQYQRDSPITEDIRKQLLQTRNSADGALPELLNGDPAYQRITTYARSLSETSSRLSMREHEKRSDLDLQAEIFLSGYMPAQRASLAKLTGATDSVSQWKFLAAQGDKKQDVIDAITTPPDLLGKTALAGNNYAMALIQQQEEAIVGKAAARDSITALKNIIADPVIAQQAFQEISIGLPAARLKEYNTTAALMYAAATNAGATTNEKKAAVSFRIDVAEKYAQHLAAKEFNADMLALTNYTKIPLPEWLAAAGTTKKVDLTTAFEVINGSPDIQTRQLRVKEFTNFYTAAAAEHNKRSTLFQINPLDIGRVQLQASSWPGLFPNTGALGAFSRVAQSIASVAIPQAKQSINQLTGALNFPFNYGAELLTADQPFTEEAATRALQRGHLFSTGAKK